MTNHPFTPADAAILLVDHQPGVVAMVQSVPAAQLTANVATLAKLANDLDLPIVITSTREDKEFLGTNLREIQQAAPAAYAARVRRAGVLNAFADPAFVAAAETTGRKNLIIAGILTDVCLYHSVVSALEAGYVVKVVADASGTSSTLADSITHDTLRALGAIIVSTYGILFELYPDLGTRDGLNAEAVASSFAPKA